MQFADDDDTPIDKAWLLAAGPPAAFKGQLCWDVGPPGVTMGRVPVLWCPAGYQDSGHNGFKVGEAHVQAIRTRGDLRHLWRALTGEPPTF